MTIAETLESRKTLMTVEELSVLLSTSTKTLYKSIKAGKLPAYRLGGIRLDPREVAAWMHQRHTAQ